VPDDINMRDFEGQEILGKYRLVKYLAEGGFGAVYRATHVAYQLELREVAVKLGKCPMAPHEAREAFGDALKLTRISDPAPDPLLREHFVTVHDAGICPDGGPLAGHPYVVMEFVRAGSLRDCLRPGPFPLKRAIRYFDQMLDAVAYMHAGVPQPDGTIQPVIHRDIKPDNILVVRRAGRDDLIKLTDFGLAIDVDKLLGWVRSGGDLCYLPPDSFLRDVCSPKSDVYMLGLVFYEMITGQAPFAEVGRHLRGTDKEKREELRKLHVAARQCETFPHLERHPEIRRRPELGQVIRAALTADMPSRPYRNAGELRAAWRQAQRGDGDETAETPRDAARRLFGEAEQCYELGDDARGDALLDAAMELNRDGRRIPDHQVLGAAYLRAVRRLIARGQLESAGKLALEGYRRRRCRSTCRAVARYYAASDSPAAAQFDQEAQTVTDQE